MTKSYEEINEKIRKGKAVVLTAEEVSEMAKTMKPKEILDKVDVVTTATFGAMCSIGRSHKRIHSSQTAAYGHSVYLYPLHADRRICVTEIQERAA